MGHWGAEEGGGAGNPNQGDGMDSLDSTVAKLRFGRDLRLMEVRRLLRSSAPVVLNTEDLQQVGRDNHWYNWNRLCVLVAVTSLPQSLHCDQCVILVLCKQIRARGA